MARIVFRKASFGGFKFSPGPKRGEGSPIVTAEFSAPWTDKHREAGGWKELPNTVSGSIKLVPDSLPATNITFVPNKGMEKFQFSMVVSEVSGFSVFVPTKDDESPELRFDIKSPHDKAGRTLDQFGRNGGTVDGTLTITYDEPTQPDLPGTDQTTMAAGTKAEEE